MQLHTDELEDGVGTEQNSLLHTGGVQFVDQVRQDRYNQSVVHTIKETGDECHDDDGTSSCLWIHVGTVTLWKGAVKKRSALVRKSMMR